MENKGNAFLNTQYPSLSSSKEVKRAVIASGEARIGNKEERTGFYLGRLEKILTRKRYGGGKSGQDMLEHLLVAEMVLDMENEELVLKLAKGLYESQKRIAIERGQGSDVEKYEMTDEHLIEKYKGAIREKAEIQKRSLGAWFTYLKENDAQYPLWFRYYVVRSLMDMGQFNRDDVTYTNRSETTISAYPEMNAEALAFVYKSVEHQLSTESVPQEVEEAIIRDVKLDEDIRVKIATLKEESQYNATQSALKNARAKARTEYLQKQKEKQNKTFLEGVSLDDDRKEELSEELLKRLGTKKFSNLYAFAQVETAGNLDRESLVGEWEPRTAGV